MCAYQESKKRVDVGEGQLPKAPGPTWIEGVTCMHQLCVFRLIVLGWLAELCVNGGKW